MVVTNFIFLFLAVYSNIRVFLFQVHNWAQLFTSISLCLVWLGSGYQRTEILLKTNAYSKLKKTKQIIDKPNDDDDDDFVEEIRAYFWKMAILLYEIAQVMSLFSLISFWVIWKDRVFEFYRYDHPTGRDPVRSAVGRQVFRMIVCIWINTIPPVYMFFDLLLTKMIFKMRHVLFHVLIMLSFLAVFEAGSKLIPDNTLPLHSEDFMNYYTPAGFVVGCIIHFLYCAYTNIRFKMTRDPREVGGEDTEVEKIIKRYKSHIKRKVKATEDSISGSFTQIRASYILDMKDTEFRFMREAIYNYLDTEVERPRLKWALSSGTNAKTIEEIKEESSEQSGVIENKKSTK